MNICHLAIFRMEWNGKDINGFVKSNIRRRGKTGFIALFATVGNKCT